MSPDAFGTEAVAAEADGYLRRGFALLPIRPGTKEPHAPCSSASMGGPARPLRERPALMPGVRAWIEADPDLGLGVLTGKPSGFVVLDVDRRAPELGHPPTPAVRTPRGWHLYLAADSTASRELACGDLKGDGGYVLAPPSRHPNGTGFEWSIRPDDAPLARLQGVRGIEPAPSPSGGAAEVQTSGSSEPAAIGGNGSALALLDHAVLAALDSMGARRVPLGRKLPCLLPGHGPDRHPSAAMHRSDTDGIWRLTCFHGEPSTHTLAEVRASLRAARVVWLRGPSQSRWYRRLFHEPGLLCDGCAHHVGAVSPGIEVAQQHPGSCLGASRCRLVATTDLPVRTCAARDACRCYSNAE